jgi:hypothetical protein
VRMAFGACGRERKGRRGKGKGPAFAGHSVPFSVSASRLNIARLKTSSHPTFQFINVSGVTPRDLSLRRVSYFSIAKPDPATHLVCRLKLRHGIHQAVFFI